MTRPIPPINVDLAASDSVHLQNRYDTAIGQSLPAAIKELEGRVNEYGRVSFNCHVAGLVGFLRDREYKNRHQLVREGKIQPDPGYALRKLIEQALGFGADGERIVYGSLNIGNCGCGYFGEYCVVLKKAAVAGRTSFLEDDAYAYFAPNLLGTALIGQVPQGSRATWDNVSKLAVAKLHGQGELCTMSPRDVPGMNRSIAGFSHYIEAHVHGGLTPRDVEAIRVPFQLMVRLLYLRDRIRRRPRRPLPPDDQLYLDMHLVAIELVESFKIPLVPTE